MSARRWKELARASLILLLAGAGCGSSPAAEGAPDAAGDAAAADSADRGDAPTEASPSPRGDGGAPGPSADLLLAFGAACASSADCESNLCAAFGDGTKHCTLACADATACPDGSQGPKCNGKGYCAF
jgi:hypothetical protein